MAPHGSTFPPACSKPPFCWRRNSPPCSAAWSRRKSSPRPLSRWAIGRTSARPSATRVAAAGRPPPAGGGVRRRQPGRVRQLHRRQRRSRRLALDYVRATQAGTLPRLARPSPQGRAGVLAMDAATRTSLEIQRARDGGTRHSLLGTVQRTLTPAGARLLAGWLAAPLTDRGGDRRAAGRVGLVAGQPGWEGRRPAVALHRGPRRILLKRRSDDYRLGRGGPRGPRRVARWISQHSRRWPCFWCLICCPICCDRLAAPAASMQHRSGHWAPDDALTDPAPHRLDDGNAILRGFDAELDAERALRDDSRRVLATLQLDCAQRYGVASLKIRHHAQLGYVIEVPGRLGGETARLPRTDAAPGHGQWRALHHCRNSPTSTAASPRPASAPLRANARCSPIWCSARWHMPTRSPPAPMRWPCWTRCNRRRSWRRAARWCRPAGHRRR